MFSKNMFSFSGNSSQQSQLSYFPSFSSHVAKRLAVCVEPLLHLRKMSGGYEVLKAQVSVKRS